MAKSLMIQGTMSDVGKSMIVSALCRYFANQAIQVFPFKSQNMSLNTYRLKDGGEIALSQVSQAHASKRPPEVTMNPICLKPCQENGSEVIYLGQSLGIYPARDYHQLKPQLKENLKPLLKEIFSQNDLVIMEGAGSPVELNLKDHDFVNMGLALMTGSPVLLVADIDRGGVFASIYGTLALLQPEERQLVKGILINKFRGDLSLLQPGIKTIESLTGLPVLGVIPYLPHQLWEEDSLALDHLKKSPGPSQQLDLAVLKLDRIDHLEAVLALNHYPGLSLRLIQDLKDLDQADLVLIPHSLDLDRRDQIIRHHQVYLENYISLGGEVLVVGPSEWNPPQVHRLNEQEDLLDEQKLFAILNPLLEQKHMAILQTTASGRPDLEREYDRRADHVIKHLDREQLQAIIDEGRDDKWES